MRFINRKKELAELGTIHARKEAQFIVLFGRRRIGKTTLIDHWIDHLNGQHVFWTAYKSSSSILLKKFSEALLYGVQGITEGATFSSWEDAFTYAFNQGLKKCFVLAIDEFPYLLESVPEVSSILQSLWDRIGKKGKIRLLLCGSHYHMMFDEFLSGRRPLYGRSTSNILLEEIRIENLSEFLPHYSPEQRLETYSVIGGIPKYLELWDSQFPVSKNIENLILSPNTIFRQEGVFLIQDEIAEPRTYLAILESIGNGLRTPKQISDKVGIASSHIGKYLHTLCELNFVNKVISCENIHVTDSRTSRYEIKDAYLKFFFQYIYPNTMYIEQGRTKHLLSLIQKSFNSHVGASAYEALARKHLVCLGDSEKLPFIPEYVGRIWNRRVEIDVVAISKSSSQVILGECKWTKQKVSEKDLDDLIDRSRQLKVLSTYTKAYVLFSKLGFTQGLKKRAKKERVNLYEGTP